MVYKTIHFPKVGYKEFNNNNAFKEALHFNQLNKIENLIGYSSTGVVKRAFEA